VQHLLVVTGQASAAVAFGAVAAERSRRRTAIARMLPGAGDAALRPDAVFAVRERRLSE
jgi:hypothetical protein